MEGKTPAMSEVYMSELVLPNDTNLLGNLLGGRLMHWIDIAGGKEVKMTNQAYLVYVALDRSGSPIKVLPLIPETEEEKQEYLEAEKRRERRISKLRQNQVI
jgi:acyl-CoA hydrolase